MAHIQYLLGEDLGISQQSRNRTVPTLLYAPHSSWSSLVQVSWISVKQDTAAG